MPEIISENLDLKSIKIKKFRKAKPDKLPQNFNVDTWKLTEELEKWVNQYNENKKAGLERPEISNYIGGEMLKIAKGISCLHNFRGYSFKNEMIGEAIIHVIKYLYNFDANYVTQAGTPPGYTYIYNNVYQSFRNTISREELEQMKKYKSIEIMGGADVFSQEDSSGETIEGNSSRRDLIQDQMNKLHEFEEKVRIKKQEKQEKRKNRLAGKVVEEDEVDPLIENSVFLFMEDGEE